MMFQNVSQFFGFEKNYFLENQNFKRPPREIGTIFVLIEPDDKEG